MECAAPLSLPPTPPSIRSPRYRTPCDPAFATRHVPLPSHGIDTTLMAALLRYTVIEHEGMHTSHASGHGGADMCYPQKHKAGTMFLWMEPSDDIWEGEVQSAPHWEEGVKGSLHLSFDISKTKADIVTILYNIFLDRSCTSWPKEFPSFC